jgi:putative addiction module killer protein
VPEQIRIGVFRKGDRAPLDDWLNRLKDSRALAIVQGRLDRLAAGNFGDYRSVGDGVQELRIDYGPGYRIYFGRLGAMVVILLCGGDKSTQTRDVQTARKYWKEYKDGLKSW